MKKLRVISYQLPITFVIFTLCSLLALLFTWPLVLNMSSATYGYSGDSFGSIYYFWWWRYTFLNRLPFRINPLQEAPFGVTFDQETGVLFFYWPVKLLSLITNATFAYNFILILSFPLAGLAMYFLVREILSDRSRIGQKILRYSRSEIREKTIPERNPETLVALIAGLIFAFSPYHYWKAFQHLDLALIWCLPFFIYTLIRFERTQNLKNSLLMAFGFLTTVLTNYYYGYFALLFVIIFGAARLFQSLELRPSTRSTLLKVASSESREATSSGLERSIINLKKRYLNKRFLGFSILSFFCVIIVTAILAYPVIKDARQISASQESFVRHDSYKRPFLNLVSLSARPWDYLIPSQDHLLWGKRIPELYEWIQKQGSDFKTVSTFPHERTIYLGIVTIFGALYSVYYTLSSRRHPEESAVSSETAGDEGPSHNRKGILRLSTSLEAQNDLFFPFLITAAAFFLISMPPYIFFKGRTIYLPSSVLYKIFPMFRSYVRVGVMVLICLLVVAGFGLNEALKTLRDRWEARLKQKHLLTFSAVVLSAVVIFDFINIPPAKVTKFFPLPPAYAWLKEQPEKPIIIEYPESFNVADGLLYQIHHQKPFLNFHTHSPYFGLWTNISDFYNFRTPEKLAALGVKYAFIHKELLFPQENPVDDLWYTRALKEPLDFQRLSPEFELIEDFPKTAVYEVATKYPPKMVVVTEKAGEIRSEVVGGSDWRWEKEENRIYIMNLISGEATKELKAALAFQSNPKGWKNLKAVSFNGEIIEFSNSLDLTLKSGENILLFEGTEPSSWEFRNLSVIASESPEL